MVAVIFNFNSEYSFPKWGNEPNRRHEMHVKLGKATWINVLLVNVSSKRLVPGWNTNPSLLWTGLIGLYCIKNGNFFKCLNVYLNFNLVDFKCSHYKK